MMGEWNLPKQADLAGTSGLQIERILVDYNGPQIVTASGPRGLYLGVAADEDDRAVRWIYAPITNTELRALAAGVLTTLDAVLKSRVYVVDVGHDDVEIQAWECDGALLGDENLPDFGALLPKATRNALMATMSQSSVPQLCLERPDAKRKSVVFQALSDVLNTFQRLWNALAQAASPDGPRERGRWSAELIDSAALSLAAAGTGSLILDVEPSDAAVFKRTSLSFEELVGAGSNPQALAEVLARLGARVQGRYEELLINVEKHDLQILAKLHGAAFLGPNTAARVRLSLPQSIYGDPKTRPAVGYFIAFDTGSATFEFLNEEDDVLYKGQVHPEVLAKNSSVAVGAGVTHAVFIEVTTRIAASKHVTETYALRAIAPPLPAASPVRESKPATTA